MPGISGVRGERGVWLNVDFRAEAVGFALALEHAVCWQALCGLRGVSAGWGVSWAVGDDFVGGRSAGSGRQASACLRGADGFFASKASV